MGRYFTETIDKAEQLEEWVLKIAENINENLDNAKLYDVSLDIREPFEIDKQKYNNGFVGMRIKFTFKEPNFLNGKDKKIWYSKMKEIAEKKFGIDTILARNLDYASIDFEESSEEDLYKLTSKKEKVINEGFERIKNFIDWYCSSVKQYNEVIDAHNKSFGNYLKKIEF